MTDPAKALAFARECLKFEFPEIFEDDEDGTVSIIGEGDLDAFNFEDAADVQASLEQFLGEHFFIQINRGTTSLFKWSVIVGPQNLLGATPNFDIGRGDSDDLFDAIFDACVNAARLFPHVISGAP